MSKAVMTIHGFLTDTKDFGRLYEYLNFYDEVVPLEIPGHGAEPNFKEFNVESVLTSITSCYDNLRKKHSEVDVIGFSMGGALATYLAATRDVNRCVLLSPSNKFLNPHFVFESIKYYSAFKRKIYKSSKGKPRERRAAVRQAMKPYRRNMAISLNLEFKRILPNFNRHTYKVFKKLMQTANKTLQSRSPIETPTLLIRGNLDELVPKKTVKLVLKHFENCKSVAIEDVGYGMLLTNRDNALIPLIVEFLTDGEIVPVVPFRDV